VWELQGHGTVTSGPTGPAGDGAGTRREVLPPWFDIRLTFADGARIDVLAVVSDGRIALEDMHAEPPLSLDGYAALADWIEGPLEDVCQAVAEQHHRLGAAGPGPYAEDGHEEEGEGEAGGGQDEHPAVHRARPSSPRGSAGRRVAAEAYREAQQEGRDPVLAVMNATGYSRRKSLRLIAGARDDGYLTPRHNRR
jgi:hypothetical protein